MSRHFPSPAPLAFLVLMAEVASGAAFAPHGPVMLPDDASGKFGWAVASLGDIEGDGDGDYAVSAPLTGFVRIYSGGAATLLHEIAASPADQFGTAIAALPDADGDGRLELGVGSPLATGAAGSMRAGRVDVFFSADRSALAWPPGLTILGTHADGRLGSALAGATDIDGDLVPDLVAAAPLAHDAAGVVGVVSLGLRGVHPFAGVASALVVGGAPGDEIGEHGIATRGDLWLIGAPDAGAAGRVYLMEGSGSGPIEDVALRTWEGLAPEEGLGFDVALHEGPAGLLALASAFNADGADGRIDGYDVATGARVLVVRGTSAGTAGASFAFGDFDGDGHDDLLVGAPVAQIDDRSPGAVALLRGPLVAGSYELASQAALIHGAVNSGRFGFEVDVVPAPDAAHPAGLLVGAPRVAPQAHLLLNFPPIALSIDRTVVCQGPVTPVPLDGSPSNDPDGDADITSYEWRYANGTLLGSSENATAHLTPGEWDFELRVRDAFLADDTDALHARVTDEEKPSVRLTRLDEPTIYLEDDELLTLPVPFILFATEIGRGRFVAEASDRCSPIDRVEFYLDDELVAVDREAPYEWLRDPHAVLPAFDRVRARAFDTAGNAAEDCQAALDAGWVSLHHLPVLGEGPPPVEEWNVLPPREPRDIIGAGSPCPGEWILPIIDEPIPVERILPVGSDA